MYFVGIDPGITGAVAIVSTQTGEVEFHDTPVLNVPRAKGKARLMMDPHGASLLLRAFVDKPAYVALEKVGAMPRMAGGEAHSMGATSAFSFGQGYGIWIGVLATLRLRYELVAPQRWKHAMMPDSGKEKDASRLRAMQLFPQITGALRLKKHHGRADALLLACYAQRCYGQGLDVSRATNKPDGNLSKVME